MTSDISTKNLHLLADTALFFAKNLSSSPRTTIGDEDVVSPADSPSRIHTPIIISQAPISGGYRLTPCTKIAPLSPSDSLNRGRCKDCISSIKRYNTRSTKRKLCKASPERLKSKRNELKERAAHIQSLDNSPVNNRQLLVLRMVYDEITMYPSEAWMAIVAVVINRSLKQVKNWFSNERQKNKPGEVVSVQSSEGERVRLRPEASHIFKDSEWSDDLFEEIVMVFNFKLIRQSHWNATVSSLYLQI